MSMHVLVQYNYTECRNSDSYTIPNFNMLINDPQPRSCLKLQVQVNRAIPEGPTYMATVYYQIVYRVQDHVIDITLLNKTNDFIFINVELEQVPNVEFVPKQLIKHKLKKFMHVR